LPGTDLGEVSQFHVPSPGVRWVVLPDPDGAGMLLARGDVRSNRYVVRAGGGESPPGVVSDPLEVLLTSVRAIDPHEADNTLDEVWMALEGSAGVELARWQSGDLAVALETGCDVLPDGTVALGTLKNGVTPLAWWVAVPSGSSLNPFEL